VFVPVAMVLEYGVHASPTLIFVVSCLAVIPLAGLMGHATEELAERMGEGVGGLLNATFGNAAELIIAVVALQAGLVDAAGRAESGALAKLLASMSASVTQHLATLPGKA
jgi:Ca2+:H+ antiporter